METEITFFFILCSLVFNVISIESEKQPQISITTDNGQKYNCVSFYKQPAFGDSSLNLEVVSNLTKLQDQKSVSGIGLGSRRCPIGTVPILELSNQHVYPEGLEPHAGSRYQAKQHCSAKVQTIFNANKKFFGAAGAITLYKPNVQGNQWSTSRIKLLNGGTGGDSIEAGWMINPSKFNDNNAHLYASFSANGRGCINLDCPGFVQVATDIPLGISPNSYSTFDTQIVWALSIEKQYDGNWWLSITSNKKPIGYWPKSLFSWLQDVANQVEFGGEINNPNAVEPPTPMGNGLKAAYDTNRSSCFFRATVIDETKNNVNPPDTEKFADCPDLYSVLDGGYQKNPKLGRLIFYGGPNNGPRDDARV